VKKKFFNFLLNFILLPSIILLLIYFAIKTIDLKKFYYELLNIKAKWLIITLFFSLLAIYFRALRWKLLFLSINKNPSILNLSYGIIVGYFANIGIPRFGEVFRCIYLKKTDNIEIETSLGTVITERFIDIITLFFFVIAFLISDFKFFSSFFHQNIISKISINKKIYFFLLFIIVIAIFTFFLINKLSSNLKKKLSKLYHSFTKGFLTIIYLKNKFLFFLYTILIWLFYILMTYSAFFTIESTSNLTFLNSIFIMTVGSIGMTIPVQGGFGTFHWLVTLGLELYSINKTTGMLYATILHESQVLCIIIISVFILLFTFFKKQKSISH